MVDHMSNRHYRKERNMSGRGIALLGALFLVGPMMVGCEDEIARERQVDVQEDRVVEQETRVSEQPDGDIKIEETERVEPIQ
jgi:hypothetical protein